MYWFEVLIVFEVFARGPLGFLARVRLDTTCVKHSMLVAFAVNTSIAVKFGLDTFANHSACIDFVDFKGRHFIGFGHFEACYSY